MFICPRERNVNCRSLWSRDRSDQSDQSLRAGERGQPTHVHPATHRPGCSPRGLGGHLGWKAAGEGADLFSEAERRGAGSIRRDGAAARVSPGVRVRAAGQEGGQSQSSFPPSLPPGSGPHREHGLFRWRTHATCPCGWTLARPEPKLVATSA